MAATVPVENAGDRNPLLESAQQIGVDETTKADEKASSQGAKENQPGSFERFMMSFGSPQRWAGR